VARQWRNKYRSRLENGRPAQEGAWETFLRWLSSYNYSIRCADGIDIWWKSL